MGHRRLRVAESKDHLRARLIAMLNAQSQLTNLQKQPSLFASPLAKEFKERFDVPSRNVTAFLDYLLDAMPSGELYLFGGVLRELALFGRKGFTSDIDLVVEGDWSSVMQYLRGLGVIQNRFGGFRLCIDGWPIDLWHARETWAIRRGYVQYHGIQSLTKTTILNWDAILLDWRSKRIICDENYFVHINNQIMDVVLPENPNPLGAAVRAFRQLCMNFARQLTVRAAQYLGSSVQLYSSSTIMKSEAEHYDQRYIDPQILRFFENLDTSSESSIRRYFEKIALGERQFDVAQGTCQSRLI